MKTCPRCKRKFKDLLAVSRGRYGNICDECGIDEALESVPLSALGPEERAEIKQRVMGHFDAAQK